MNVAMTFGKPTSGDDCMFTGLVTAVGRVKQIAGGDVCRITISSPYPAESIEPGASIAHDGVCLTVVSCAPEGSGSIFDLEVSPETLSKTTLGGWKTGDKVNLERALHIGDELGGHIVQGHVDGTGEVVGRLDEKGGWIRLAVKAPDTLSPFIACKGSITVNGVSLTVNKIDGHVFELMIIPRTAQVTSLGVLRQGVWVNLEVDVMARYVARLMEVGYAGVRSQGVLS